ncbi:hypothetical protein ACC709_25255 [Rhizobium ruizarguesonis]
MIAHPLPVSLCLARQMGGIEGRKVAANDMAVDDGGGHHQQTVADSQPPDFAALNMTQTPKQERRQTIHQFSSIGNAAEAESISAGLGCWATAWRPLEAAARSRRALAFRVSQSRTSPQVGSPK